MGDLPGSFQHNVSSLGRFSGRDSKLLFWPWAVFVLMASFGSAFLLFGWAMIEAMSTGMGVEDGESADSAAFAATADLGWLWQPLAAIAAFAIALLAASVTRRLHDRGWKGAWGLLPLPFLAVSIAGTPIGFRYASGESELSGLDTLMFLGSPFFYLTLAGLLYVLSGEGEPNGNRFGPPSR